MADKGVTYYQWAFAFCLLIGAPSKGAIDAVVAAMVEEGNHSNNNPLNTTLHMPGSTNLPGNTAGVQEYPNRAEGLAASVITINNQHYYSKLLRALRIGDGQEAVIQWAYSEWGTWHGNAGAAMGTYKSVVANPTSFYNLKVRSSGGPGNLTDYFPDIKSAGGGGILSGVTSLIGGVYDAAASVVNAGGDAASGAYDAAASTVSALKSTADATKEVANAVTSANFWKRVLMVIGGLVLIGGGGYVVAKTSGTV